MDIPISTTPALPGYVCTGVRGIVCGEAIMGANVFRDMLAGITDIKQVRSVCIK